MPTGTYRVVVVAPTPAVAVAAADVFAGPAYDAVLVTDFEAARRTLDERPADLLVTEVKLGAFNGLHLAIRARARGGRTQAIVVGPPDAVLEAEARRHHASYLAEPLDPAALSSLVARILRDRKSPGRRTG